MPAAASNGEIEMDINRGPSHTTSSSQAHSANVKNKFVQRSDWGYWGLTLTHLLQAFADVFSSSAELRSNHDLSN